MQGVRSSPVAINARDKLVYSPHVYGPDVHGQPYFSTSDFPTNMPTIWEDHWGFIPSTTGAACVIGEWGGPCTGNNRIWLEALVTYLRGKDMIDQFFWCLNPNSGDTGGLLKDDWTTPDQARLDLLSRLVPSPTQFSEAARKNQITPSHPSMLPPSNNLVLPSAATPTTSSVPHQGSSSSSFQISFEPYVSSEFPIKASSFSFFPAEAQTPIGLQLPSLNLPQLRSTLVMVKG